MDLVRLRQTLGKPELAWLVQRIRQRLERGEGLQGSLTLRGATNEQRAATDRLLGRPPSAGTSLTVQLQRLDLLLRHAELCAGLKEAVEALTVVLAVGVTRGWRSPLIGAGGALLALAVVIAVFGPALTLIPIDALRLVIGTLLLIFGLQWLRKAILRASGYKATRDEDAIYRAQLAEARAEGTTTRAGTDWYAFTLAFKAVFLEGLEVAFIVLTFGSAQNNIPLAALGAGLAVALVGLVGALVHQPLSRVPENTMKFAVGLMLTTFGIFWSVEGAGIEWPGADIAILGILAFLSLVSLGMVIILRRLHERHVLMAARAGAIGD